MTDDVDGALSKWKISGGKKNTVTLVHSNTPGTISPIEEGSSSNSQGKSITLSPVFDESVGVPIRKARSSSTSSSLTMPEFALETPGSHTSVFILPTQPALKPKRKRGRSVAEISQEPTNYNAIQAAISSTLSESTSLSRKHSRRGSISRVFSRSTSRRSSPEHQNFSADELNLMKKILLSLFEYSSPPVIPTNPPIATPSKHLVIDFTQWCDFLEFSPVSSVSDLWSSLITPTEKYLHSTPTNAEIVQGFNYETGPLSVTHLTNLNDFSILNVDEDFPYYEHFFYRNNSVKHYFDKTNNQIVSCIKDSKYMRTIVRSEAGIYRCIIISEDSALKCEEVFHNSNQVTRVANHTEVDDDLLHFHQSAIISKYRFGVVYAGPGQSSENEIFANNEPSQAFWKFMNLIASKVTLEGYQNYSGGLDTHTNVTGKESYATQYDNYDCMFHVAPLIPCNNNDEQSLERKRFVGNDVVVVVFKEQLNKDDLFKPETMTSHFTHVYIVVTPSITTNNNNSYKISVVSKDCVQPFPPFLVPSHTQPILPVLAHGPQARQFFMQKIINAERTALKSKTFAANSKRVLQSQINHLMEKYA
ncbi:rap GTPase-activating protein, putative [Entamoeba dispar SAW760]|uniref:Rap GTPase-activating protein, putative n=1 Tax=Entamoeba dispar (strain ATCC PRA-260 / SAW760) TaxID=370354 RepID=B0E7G4_ENTDS|nr:rap GTPase-activating protein, putative [Entamoeba dispar SAW760]EDR29535.1 rap GTPase-activating protein, putative [Entamoeba dispar SAW760]|eukprot:EDR29535.1 rap GTPase-activating protein, putative [Entamoeba dispar SAW760]